MKRLLKIVRFVLTVKSQTDNNLNDEVIPDSIILPETHSPMYMIHKYWARKPANIVAEYIKKYSNEGDTVFDPFFGSGVVLFESALLNRNVIGTDLNPFCSFLVRTMFSQWSEVEITKAVDQIKRNISKLLEEMYSIQCPKCSGLASITHVIYS